MIILSSGLPSLTLPIFMRRRIQRWIIEIGSVCCGDAIATDDYVGCETAVPVILIVIELDLIVLSDLLDIIL